MRFNLDGMKLKWMLNCFSEQQGGESAAQETQHTSRHKGLPAPGDIEAATVILLVFLSAEAFEIAAATEPFGNLRTRVLENLCKTPIHLCVA